MQLIDAEGASQLRAAAVMANRIPMAHHLSRLPMTSPRVASSRAVEDSWLNDGEASPITGADDSDDDLSFRMIRVAEGSAPIVKRPDKGVRPWKVVDLIDFAECDVAEEALIDRDKEVANDD